MQRTQIKLVLLAPFPIRSRFGDRLKFNTRQSTEHPTTWVINLIKLLTEKQPQFKLFVMSMSPHLQEDSIFRIGDITYYFLKGTRFSRQAISLFQHDRRKIHYALSQIKPDIVEAFGTEGPYAYSGVTSPYPCLVKIQGIVNEIVKQVKFVPPNLQWLHLFITQFFEKYTIQRGRNFLVHNGYTSQFIKKNNPNAKIYEIPNLINPIYFSVEKNFVNQEHSILYVGAITERKGAIDLLQSFSKIHLKYPNIKLILVGEVNMNVRGKIDDMLIQEDIANRVILTGVQSPEFIAQLFGKPAILVHPSWVDSSPNSVYEAMAAGIPVIAYNVGGLPYMIEHQQSGLIVEAHNIQNLVNAMDYFLCRPEEIIRMGNNAKKQMSEKMDHQHILGRIVDAYMDVLERGIAQ